MTSPVRAPRPTPRRTEAVPSRDRRPDLRVVPAPVRARRTGAVVAAATVVVFGSLLASAVFHSVLVKGQLHLDNVDRQVEVEREQLRRDQLALAQAQAPQRLADEAAAQGMVDPSEQTWLDRDGGSPVTTGGSTVDDADTSSSDTSSTDTSSSDPSSGDEGTSDLASGPTTPVGGAR